jgi:hypothetical protein
VICPLKYGRRSKPNQYHRSQQCPDEDNRFPRDENEKSHNGNSEDERRRALRHYKSEALVQLGLLAVLSTMPRERKSLFQMSR